MIALIQRVSGASVSVSDQMIAKIGPGMLVLAAVERGDQEETAERLAEKLLHYRLFADSEGKMNLNVQQVAGEILLVSQFTLAADTRKGLRPSFTPAAPPETGQRLFDQLANEIRNRYDALELGQFAADMQVRLTNDGPVTFWLQVPATG